MLSHDFVRRTAYKIILQSLTLLVYVKRFIVWILRLIGQVVWRVLRVLVPVVVLPGYRVFLRTKKNRERTGVGVLYFFTRPSVTIVIGFLVLMAALIAQEAAYAELTQPPGQESFAYVLLGPDEDFIIEEVVDTATPGQPVPVFAGIAPDTPGAFIDEPLDELEELSGITSLDTALGKPSIAPGAVRDARTIIAYVVEPGDTLSQIASKFNVSTATIMWENKLLATSVLRPGTSLKILPVSGVSYKVKKGDNLSKIANAHKVEAARVLAFNHLASDQDLVIGETIIIPGGSAQEGAAPKVKKETAAVGFSTAPAPPASPHAATAGMVWPTSGRYITQYFTRRHHGVDIDGDYNSPIYASAGGVVAYAGWNKGGYGFMVDIDHGNGLKTRYSHASKLFVRTGDEVTKGQTIAMVGTTGRSTGTHLHFEVLQNKQRLNPFKYIR